MRVLHFFKTYLPDTTGGIEQVIYQLCEGGRSLGVEAEVLTLSPAPHAGAISVGSHRVTQARLGFSIASTGFSVQAFSLFAKMASHVDLVHFHFPWPMMDLVHFATRHGRPTVVSYHSDIVRQQTLLAFYRPLMKRFLASVDRIIVSSPNYLASSETLRPYHEKTVVVPFGLERAAYPVAAPERLEKWRRLLGEKFFLFVGVLRYYKGLATALEALKGLDYPLVILGSGPEEQALKGQAHELGLTNVHFLGRLDDDDKVCLLQLCHAMLFPSHLRSEAFGISLLEASMYGKPMISCEIGTGTTFVNQHGATGLSVPPADPVALRVALQRLWGEPELARRFGVNAEKRFARLFTAQRMCEETARIYRSVLEERSNKQGTSEYSPPFRMDD
jgi:glycosyltransferase involved in cell wall biosynthesis